MNRYPLSNLCWFSVLAVALGCALVQAQQPAADAIAENLAPETNPAVLAALELPRITPSHYVSAILSLVDLGRPELARPFLDELQSQKLTDAQRADLVREFGTQRMMRLERVPELAPTAGEFADACLSAAAAEARHPERINKLIDQLADPSAEVRHAARVDLVSAGMPGIVATLEAWANAPDSDRKAAIGAAIPHMRPLVTPPLLAIASTRNPALSGDAIDLLVEMRVDQAVPLAVSKLFEGSSHRDARQWRQSARPKIAEMLGVEPTREIAQRMVTAAFEHYRRGAIPFPPDEDNRITIWKWSDRTKTLTPTAYESEQARKIWMARLAQALADMDPKNPDYRRQALKLRLETEPDPATTRPTSFDDAMLQQPTAQHVLASADNAMLNRLLADAMKDNYTRAAAATAEVLGSRKDATVLFTRDGRPAPLVDALDYPDRRVRFAALAAVMQIAPASPFPGSSRVPETLGYFARGTGERRAVVAMPTIERAANVAGRLRAAGIDAAPANRGAEAVKLAQQSPDVEFALVDMDIQAPGVRDVIYALRIDPATGHMPIGLLAGEGRLEAAQALAAEHQRVLAFSRPHSDERTTTMADQLVALAGHNDVSPDERADQSRQAIAWLAELLDKGPTFYNLRRQSNVIQAAALRPEAPGDSLAALATLGTPAGQRALVNLASLQTIPIARRREAAQAFDQSIQEFGLLLTSDEIVRQYDRYNASATADADTQQVLGAVLDTIESQRTPLQTPSCAP